MDHETLESPDSSESDWPRRIDDAVQQLTLIHSQSIELLVPKGSSAGTPPKVILAGSFNPLHVGHCRMADVAAEITGEGVHFELSINNAEKAPIDVDEIGRRILPGLVRPRDCQSGSESALARRTMFSPHGLLLSNHATFVRKAAEYGEVTFAVGIDTWIRIGDEAFYPPGRRDAAIEMIAAMGSRFLVFGREMDGQFVSLSLAESTRCTPESLREISYEVPETKFRSGMSSTEIRNENNPN